jgi:hypothetical protein
MYMSVSQASAAGAGKSTRRKAQRRAKAAPPVVQAALGPDGVLQQEMLLAPYTRTGDLLHLSTAARWLKPFRFQFESVHLRIPKDLLGHNAKVLKMATSLLSMQQRLRRLRIEAGWLVVPALTALKTGVSQGKTLQSLDISMLASLRRRQCDGLSAALIAGACPALTVFETHGTKLTGEELGCFAAAIRAGAFCQLREIILAPVEEVGFFNDSPAVTEVMRALEAHGCPMLTKLSLSRCRIDRSGFAALERAVRGGSLSGLQAFDLQGCGGGYGTAAGLVEALAEGGCPYLQALDLSRAGVTEGEMLPLLTALGERRLPHLKSLTLGGRQIAQAGMAAMSEAMLQGQEIEELSIRSTGCMLYRTP